MVQDKARNMQQLLNTANVNKNIWLIYASSICCVGSNPSTH
jgi:hypothetical protein